MNLVVYDLASLEIQWTRGRTSARLVTANDVTLSWRSDIPAGATESEVAFLVFEDALERARVVGEEGNSRRVGLYNPYTGQISVGATPATQVYGGAGPLDIPLEGRGGTAQEGQLVFDNGVLCTLAETSLRALTRRISSHLA